MPILWVAREVGSNEFVDPLRAVGIDARLATLDSADFCFEGNGPDGKWQIGVERKALSDLVTSLRDGRLCGLPTEEGKGGQLHRLLNTYDAVWLLVEGVWATDAAGRLHIKGRHRTTKLPGSFTEDSLTKQLLSIEVKSGIHVHHTSGKTQTVSWLGSLLRWWTDKTWDQHHTLNVVHQRHRSMTPISTFREMTLPLPGLGLAGSKAMEKCFGGSLGRLLQATVADLSAVQLDTPTGPRRFGDSQAAELRTALNKLL